MGGNTHALFMRVFILQRITTIGYDEKDYFARSTIRRKMAASNIPYLKSLYLSKER